MQRHSQENWIRVASPLILASLLGVAAACGATDLDGLEDPEPDAGSPDTEVEAALVSGHPRLLFDANELTALKSRTTNTAYTEMWNRLVSDANGYGPVPTTAPADARYYADRLMTLGLVQALDPTQPNENKLKSYFWTILRYPNWTQYTLGDLAHGQLLTALCLVYDWHYAKFNSTERTEIRTKLLDYMKIYLQKSYALRSWSASDWRNLGALTNNHYWINHEALAAVTYVLADEMDSTTYTTWKNKIESDLAEVFKAVGTDGASSEGVAYHSYGMVHLIPWVEMRDRHMKQSSLGQPFLKATCGYDMYSIIPSATSNYGGIALFGDGPPYHYYSLRTYQAWAASRYDDGWAQWLAQNSARRALSPLAILWYDPTVAPKSLDRLPNGKLFSYKGIYAWRSSWQNDATHLNVKSGSYHGGHEKPDAGQILLSRAGVPYLTPSYYSYKKMTDEHSVVLIDSVGQRGEGNMWMPGTDPTYWPKVVTTVTDSAYFDVVMDPTKMYLSSKMSGWKREVVGLGPDIIVVNDDINLNQTGTISWLLHSHRSRPPTSAGMPYTFVPYRLENAFASVSSRAWTLKPQDTALPLQIADVSGQTYSSTVEASFMVPESNPDTGASNYTALKAFQFGHRLRRTLVGTRMFSTMAMTFGTNLSSQKASTSDADAVRVMSGATAVAYAIWPRWGQSSTVPGFAVVGKMGGRRLDQPAYFGRAITSLKEGTRTLITSSVAAEVFARLEHVATSTDARRARVKTTATTTTLSLYCPQQPVSVTRNGVAQAYQWSNGTLTVSLPAGQHLLTVQ